MLDIAGHRLQHPKTFGLEFIPRNENAFDGRKVGSYFQYIALFYPFSEDQNLSFPTATEPTGQLNFVRLGVESQNPHHQPRA